MIAIGLLIFLKPEVGKGQCPTKVTFPKSVFTGTQTITNSNFPLGYTEKDLFIDGDITIDGSTTINFVENTGIIISKTGKLTINAGAVLQNYSFCNNWNGIVIEGDKDEVQYNVVRDPVTNEITSYTVNNSEQGYLICVGATISNALIGVNAFGGGAYEISNTNFINNQIGVKANENGILSSNRDVAKELFLSKLKPATFIENCSFTVNSSFLTNYSVSDYASLKHNDFKDCAYVLVTGTEYLNSDASTSYDFDKRGTGIYIENSNLLLVSGEITVETFCISFTNDITSFTDLSFGIDGRNSNNNDPLTKDYTVYCVGPIFRNNYQALVLKYGKGHLITSRKPTDFGTTGLFEYEKSNLKWNSINRTGYTPFFIGLFNSGDNFIWYCKFLSDEDDYLFYQVYLDNDTEFKSTINNNSFTYNGIDGNNQKGLVQKGDYLTNVTCNSFNELDVAWELDIDPVPLNKISLGANINYNFYGITTFGLQNLFSGNTTDIDSKTSDLVEYVVVDYYAGGPFEPQNLIGNVNVYDESLNSPYDCSAHENTTICYLNEKWPNLESMNIAGVSLNLKTYNSKTLPINLIYLDNNNYQLQLKNKNFDLHTELELISSDGKIIQPNFFIRDNSIEFNLNGYSKGIYLVKIVSKEEQGFVKLFNN
jgi:hypothetical protein